MGIELSLKEDSGDGVRSGVELVLGGVDMNRPNASLLSILLGASVVVKLPRTSDFLVDS